jgi:hypothetical protein
MKKELSHEGQFEYLGKWVDKHSFRAFVYNEKGEEKLADTYKEFEDLTSSGIWYSSKDLTVKGRKPKNDSVRAVS